VIDLIQNLVKTFLILRSSIEGRKLSFRIRYFFFSSLSRFISSFEPSREDIYHSKWKINWQIRTVIHYILKYFVQLNPQELGVKITSGLVLFLFSNDLNVCPETFEMLFFFILYWEPTFIFQRLAINLIFHAWYSFKVLFFIWKWWLSVRYLLHWDALKDFSVRNLKLFWKSEQKRVHI